MPESNGPAAARFTFHAARAARITGLSASGAMFFRASVADPVVSGPFRTRGPLCATRPPKWVSRNRPARASGAEKLTGLRSSPVVTATAPQLSWSEVPAIVLPAGAFSGGALAFFSFATVSPMSGFVRLPTAGGETQAGEHGEPTAGQQRRAASQRVARARAREAQQPIKRTINRQQRGTAWRDAGRRKNGSGRPRHR